MVLLDLRRGAPPMTDTTASPALSLPRRRLASWALLLGQSFAAHWLVLALPVLALIANELILATIDEPRRAGILALLKGMVTVTLPVVVIVILLLRFVQMLFYEKPASPLFVLIGEVKSLLCTPVRLIHALPVIVAVLLCSKAMLDIKMNIPALHPFSWDEALMRLDRQLHGGVDPWLLLQPVLGYPPITFVINVFYNMWLAVLFATWVYVAFRPSFDVLRLQFLIAFMIAWLFGGALLATVFSSAGPVYYGLIGLSPDPFVPLLDYLHTTNETVPLLALNAQQLLWDGYTGEIEKFMGISAFPSMHNAMVTLFALLGWRLHRMAGILLTTFAALILIGSVHLAWHYAVDSYAGILIGVLSWWVAGRLAQWNMRLPQVRQYRIEQDRLAR
jgi:membrane-associated phospholipid phosphatase